MDNKKIKTALISVFHKENLDKIVLNYMLKVFASCQQGVLKTLLNRWAFLAML